MIEYKIKDPDFFIRAMNSVATVIDETVLQFGNGIRSYGMDGSRIVLYELMIGKSQLEIIKDGKIDIVVNLTDFKKILDRLKYTTELTIQYNQNTITIIGKVDNKKKTFKLRILNTDAPVIPLDALRNMPLDITFDIDLVDLVDIMEDSEIYNEYFNLISTGDRIVVTASGPVGEMESEITLEDRIVDGSSGYSLQYAKSILKALGSTEVVVAFNEDMPIMFFNKISNDSFIRWYLSPRVDHDGDDDDWDDPDEFDE